MQDPFYSQPPQYPPQQSYPSNQPTPPPSSGDAYPQQPYAQQPYPPQQPYPSQPIYPPQQTYPPYGTGFQPQPPRKKRPWIWVIVGVILVLVIGGVVAAAANGGKSTTSNPQSTPQANSNATTAPTQASVPTQASSSSSGPHKVGDVVSIDSWQAVVNSVKISHGGQFDTPKNAGDVYLEIDVSVTNQTGKSQTISSFLNFALKDSTGQKYDETIVSNVPSTPDGAVQNNGKLRGTLTYEVPPTMKSFELDFTPDLFGSNDVAAWNLTAS